MATSACRIGSAHDTLGLSVGLFDSTNSATLSRGRLRFFPVIPGRFEFAEAVREEIKREPPHVIAVELPATLEQPYLRAAERLPEMSIIIYDDEADERAVYVPVEPTDAFAEALRLAKEREIETAFLDPDLSERPHLAESYPDPYAICRVGLGKYIESYRLHSKKSHEASVHAEGVAWKLQGCDPEAEILVVVSLNLLDPLLDAMQRPQTQPMRKVRRKGVHVLNLHPDSLPELCSDIPFLQAAYEARRSGKIPEPPKAVRVERTLFGLGVLDPPRMSPKDAALAEVAQADLDRPGAHLRILGVAEMLYEKKTGETVAHWQRRTWARYSRNLALAQGRLLPSLFDLTVAARSIVDDNFGWEYWDAAAFYPHQKTETDLATVKVTGEQMWLNSRRILLRPRVGSSKGKPRPLGLKGRKREKTPGEWKSQWTPGGICSYPPEDLKIEDYGLYLKKKGKSLLSEERSRTEPFSTSLHDGIDIRETLRNWHDGKKIYVRENQKVAGDVGAVIVIFDEDRDNRYSYCMTWLGEHQNESDMAFYATNPFDNVVGPGIGRAEYGGLLLSLPSRRMLDDVWTDRDYSFAESKPETLLLAAIDYSLEKMIVYVAPKPPRSVFRSIAARLGRKIIYIPRGQLSPTALKKLRVMHVLDSHDRRETAKEYIW